MGRDLSGEPGKGKKVTKSTAAAAAAREWRSLVERAERAERIGLYEELLARREEDGTFEDVQTSGKVVEGGWCYMKDGDK